MHHLPVGTAAAVVACYPDTTARMDKTVDHLKMAADLLETTADRVEIAVVLMESAAGQVETIEIHLETTGQKWLW